MSSPGIVGKQSLSKQVDKTKHFPFPFSIFMLLNYTFAVLLLCVGVFTNDSAEHEFRINGLFGA